MLFCSYKSECFNGKVRILKLKNSPWWIEKVTILERCHLNPTASFVTNTSGAAMILVSLLTMDLFPAEMDECLSSSVQGFWCVVYRFYWTSVNPQLGYASSYNFNLFLRCSALGLEQGGLGGVGLIAARGRLSNNLGFPCNLEQGDVETAGT